MHIRVPTDDDPSSGVDYAIHRLASFNVGARRFFVGYSCLPAPPLPLPAPAVVLTLLVPLPVRAMVMLAVVAGCAAEPGEW